MRAVSWGAVDRLLGQAKRHNLAVSEGPMLPILIARLSQNCQPKSLSTAPHSRPGNPNLWVANSGWCWPSCGWWVTFPGIVGDPGPSFGWWVTTRGMVDDHRWKGGWPYLGWWRTILGMIVYHPEDSWWLDHPWDNGLASVGWWVTLFGMVGDLGPSLEWWVTILGMVDDRPQDGAWSSWDWHLTVLRMVYDHSLEDGWPSMLYIGDSSLCYLSLWQGKNP